MIRILFFFLILQVAQSANAIAHQVRAAFSSTSGLSFNLQDNLVSASRGRGRGRGRGGSRGSGRGGGSGRGRGQENNNLYCFNVILLNPGQSSIPRGSTRSELESNGRVKTLEIPRGATPRTTYQRLLSLFPELDGLESFFLFFFLEFVFICRIFKLITCQSFSPSSLI